MGKQLTHGFAIVERHPEEDVVVFHLRCHYKNGTSRDIGYCELIRQADAWHTHSEIRYKKYRNKGFGIILYTRAIEWALHRGYSVSSSSRHTKMASRLWQSTRLRRLFKIKEVHGNYVVNKRKRKTVILHKDGVKIVPRKKYGYKRRQRNDLSGTNVKKSA